MRLMMLALAAWLAALPTLASDFIIKSEDVLLYRDHRLGILVLHNPTGTLMEHLRISFPGRVQVRELITHDGVMDLMQQGTTVVLEGALLRNGFVQLRWYPGFLLPTSATWSGPELEWTVGLASARWASHPPEVRTAPGEAMITRRQGDASWLRLEFDIQITVVNLVGIGCQPRLTTEGRELFIEAQFTPGAGVWLEWAPPEAQLLSAHWEDREATDGPLSPGLGFLVEMGDEGVTFRALAGEGQTYVWDLGDGTQASGPQVQHHFLSPGSYLVTLLVTDSEGYQYIYQTWVQIPSSSEAGEETGASTEYPPLADPGGPYGPYDWLEDWSEEWPVYYFDVLFDASASGDTDGGIIQYIWRFGDGTQVSTTSPYVVHRYQVEEGEFPEWLPSPEHEWGLILIPVTLTVVDDQGLRDTATTYVEVYAPWWYGEWVE